MMLLCAIFFSLQILALDYLTQRFDPVLLSSGQFFVTGILGGFTTFSTYNMELLTFVRTGAVFPALAYFSFNVIGGFVCCWLGFATGNALWG